MYDTPDDGVDSRRPPRLRRTAPPVHGPQIHEGCLNAPVVNEIAFAVPSNETVPSECEYRCFATTFLSRETKFNLSEDSELCGPLRFIMLFPNGDMGWAPMFWRTVPPSLRPVPERVGTPPISDDEAAPPGRFYPGSDSDNDSEVPVSFDVNHASYNSKMKSFVMTKDICSLRVSF